MEYLGLETNTIDLSCLARHNQDYAKSPPEHGDALRVDITLVYYGVFRPTPNDKEPTSSKYIYTYSRVLNPVLRHPKADIHLRSVVHDEYLLILLKGFREDPRSAPLFQRSRF